MPAGLAQLAELAIDLRWSWNHAADRLWKYIDPDLWDKTGNPWLILQMVSTSRLEFLAADARFQELFADCLAEHKSALSGQAWYQKHYPDKHLKIAYFCMEYGLSEALPLYSGGLGILAGDYLKTASDLGVPVVGVGLLYQQGYFRQVIDNNGDQTEFYPYNDPDQLPIMPARNKTGEWLRVSLEFPGRILRLRVWEARIGRVKLYLLDSNDPVNAPPDRGITSELYGGGPEMRLEQEIILGIGGWRMLGALGIRPEVCHLNEGHAAFTVLERAHGFMQSDHQPFRVALTATRAGNIFTTHTPVEAGFDRFSPELLGHYLSGYANELGIGLDGLLSLGRRNPADPGEPFNMAYLAMHGSGAVNAVSHLHGEVSRRIFQPLFPRWPGHEVPVTHVTNGVHVPSWDSAAADKVWTDSIGKSRWLNTLSTIGNDFKRVPDETLWKLRIDKINQLIGYIREYFTRQLMTVGAPVERLKQTVGLLDQNILTMGFARRFVEYKRPNLLLHDPDRLISILNNADHPVQVIIAGKSHPQDNIGKALIREWWQFSLRPEVRNRVVFLADYDMYMAEQLVQGVDVWINTPRRPWEACGTSGMKVLVNGGLNFSEKDGWWAEAYKPGVGWAVGDGQEHGDDPGWDAKEAEQLYQTLEDEIIPCFYRRDENGIPHAWVANMRASMSELTPSFSTNRMLREYVDRLYVRAYDRYKERTANSERIAVALSDWEELLEKYWSGLRFGKLDVRKTENDYVFNLEVFLGKLDDDAVQVQLYAEPQKGVNPEIHIMERGQAITGEVEGYIYHARIPAQRPIHDYTPRVIPFFNGASIPLEANEILWRD